MATSTDSSFDLLTQGRRPERLLERWQRVELVVGLVLVAVGFVAVGLGWYDASGTADVRRQMQALISGGFGGLAAVVLGAAIVQAHVSAKGAEDLAGKLERVADALLDLAYSASPADSVRSGSPVSPDTDQIGALSRPQALTHVLASHASYHAPGCDLAEGRDGLRELTVNQAEKEQLRPCRVCLPAQVAHA